MRTRFSRVMLKFSNAGPGSFVLDGRYVHTSNGRYYSSDSIRSVVASSEPYSIGGKHRLNSVSIGVKSSSTSVVVESCVPPSITLYVVIYTHHMLLVHQSVDYVVCYFYGLFLLLAPWDDNSWKALSISFWCMRFSLYSPGLNVYICKLLRSPAGYAYAQAHYTDK